MLDWNPPSFSIDNTAEISTCLDLSVILCVCILICFSAGENQPISSSDTQSSLHKGRTKHSSIGTLRLCGGHFRTLLISCHNIFGLRLGSTPFHASVNCVRYNVASIHHLTICPLLPKCSHAWFRVYVQFGLCSLHCWYLKPLSVCWLWMRPLNIFLNLHVCCSGIIKAKWPKVTFVAVLMSSNEHW